MDTHAISPQGANGTIHSTGSEISAGPPMDKPESSLPNDTPIGGNESHKLGTPAQGDATSTDPPPLASKADIANNVSSAGAVPQEPKVEDKEDDDEDKASVSTDDSDIHREMRDLHWDNLRDVPLSTYRKKAHKRSEVVAIYMRTLEDRITYLEEHVRALQEDKETDEEGDEKPQAVPACTFALTIDINRIDHKEWMGPTFHKRTAKRGKAIVDVSFVNFAGSQTTFADNTLQDEKTTGDASAVAGQTTGKPLPANTSMDAMPDSSATPVRVAFNSPWPSIILDQLTEVMIPESAIWVRPFKHFLIFEKEIRTYVELLNKVDAKESSDDKLDQILNETFRETLDATGLQTSDSNYLDPDFSRILRRKNCLEGHFKKIEMKAEIEKKEAEKKETAKTEGKVEPNTAAESGTGTAVEERNSGQSKTEKRKASEPSLSELVCTCLQDAKHHLRHLVQFIEKDLYELRTLRESIANGKLQKISFEHLWHLYQPGDIIVASSSAPNSAQAYRVLHVSGGRPIMLQNKADGSTDPTIQLQPKNSPFVIDAVHLDFDGERIGPVQTTVKINEYEGERTISRLKVYPLRFAASKVEFEKNLIERGRRFVELAGVQHKRYSGLTVGEPQEEVDSEVMIDFGLAFRQPEYTHWKPQLGLTGRSVPNPKELFETTCSHENCEDMDDNVVCDDTKLDKKLTDDFINAEAYKLLKEVTLPDQNISNEQLMLLPITLYGFVLRNRKWVRLDINHVKDVEEDDANGLQNTSFEDLVIPLNYKKVVKALVANHSKGSTPVRSDAEKDEQVDLIRGKGKGLIILLHGVPGVGKTSTAESVAAYTKRPLLPITCGDIGQTAEIVEKRLESLFLLARKWGCVLLLDEADVFLAKREKGGDIERNALVSVFLRVLEYYSGILFLTTNRIGSFDEAFKSRIHMSLYYPELNQESTLEVWKMNLDRIERSKRNIAFKRERIMEFAKQHWEDGNRWNGRQIRNAFQTAIALAEYDWPAEVEECKKTGKSPPERPSLRKKQFKSVAIASAQFDDYLAAVIGTENSYSEKARIERMRADQWQDRGVETSSGLKYEYHAATRPQTHTANSTGSLGVGAGAGAGFGAAAAPLTPPSHRGGGTGMGVGAFATPTLSPSTSSMAMHSVGGGTTDELKARRHEELRQKKREMEKRAQEERELAELEVWAQEQERQKTMAQRLADDDSD